MSCVLQIRIFACIRRFADLHTPTAITAGIMTDAADWPIAACAAADAAEPPETLARELLSVDDATALAGWEQLNEEELQQEVARYRASLQSLATDLASAGVSANLQNGDRSGARHDAHLQAFREELDGQFKQTWSLYHARDVQRA